MYPNDLKLRHTYQVNHKCTCYNCYVDTDIAIVITPVD